MGCVQDPQGTVVVEGSELSAVVTEIADVTAGPEEGSIALAKRIYAHLYEGNLSSRYARQETLGAVSAALRNLQQQQLHFYAWHCCLMRRLVYKCSDCLHLQWLKTQQRW